MPPRKDRPRTPEAFSKIFEILITDAIKSHGRRPRMYLEEEDDGVLVLAASVTLQETNKTLCNGYATLTIGDCAIETVKIHPSEIQTVVELIRKYQQPDPDFDPELESWERAAKQLTLVGWC